MYTKFCSKNTKDFQFRATQGTETAPAAPQTAKGAARSNWKSVKNTTLFDDSSLQREDGTRCAVRRPAVQMYDSIFKLIFVRVFDVFFVSLARHLASSHSMASRIAHVSEILLGHGFQIARHMTRSRKIHQKACVFDDLIWNRTFERQMPRSVSFDAHDLGGANRRKASCF